MHKEILVKPVKVRLKPFLNSVPETCECLVFLATRAGLSFSVSIGQEVE
jgi:hypothetical protein